MINTKKQTYSLKKEIVEQLNKLAVISRRSKSSLLEEAIELLIKTPGGKKQ
uniref:Uncharacterized protein n=1 Tax=viral metagenome TaxID=1070528 RepID=A0A6M3IS90_9ZZZZ